LFAVIFKMIISYHYRERVMPILNHGTIMRYLKGREGDTLDEIKDTILSAKNVEDARDNLLLIKSEMKCEELAKTEPMLKQGVVGGAIAGFNSALVRSAVDTNMSLSLSSVSAHAFYGAVMGTVSTLSMDYMKAPLSRFFKPCLSRLFHDKHQDVERLLSIANDHLNSFKKDNLKNDEKSSEVGSAVKPMALTK
jgi:hypothetical protein